MKKNKNPLKGLKVTYTEGDPLPDSHVEYRKKQYEEIKNNKNIIRHVVPRNFSDKEEDAAHDWWINHACFKKKDFWDQTIDLWTPYPNIELCECSIGVTIYVICPVCQEQENVTDFDIW